MLLIYTAIILISFFFIVLREGATLIRGKTLLWVHAFFIVVTLWLVTLSKESYLELTIFGFLLVVSYILRSKWFILKATEDDAVHTIENTLGRILIVYERNISTFTLRFSEGVVYIRVYTIGPYFAILSFENVLISRKFSLFQSLIRKNIHGIFPRPIIHLS